MKILVTGGAGYIGSHTTLELLKAGHDVVVVDNLCNSSEEALRRVAELAGKAPKFYNLDIRDEAALDKVVAAEKPSFLADWNDRSTCVLFGDGSGAVVLEKGGDGACLATHLATEFNDAFLCMPGPVSNSPFTAPGKTGKLSMNGQEVYRFAVSSCVSDLRAVCDQAGVSLEQVDWFLLHQANQRILNAAQLRLKQPKEKFPGNIARCGNTSSACIPLLLDEMRRDGRLRDGQLVALSAFGAGLTHGAALLRI